MERLWEAKAEFRGVTAAIDTTTPAGRLLMRMAGGFAAFERVQAAETNEGGTGLCPP